MKYVHSLVLRYLLILTPIKLFSFILTPITFYLSILILTYFNPVVINNVISINNIDFEFVEACIATLAYYLLLILTMTTKDISWKIRGKLFLYGSFLILGMNLIRILILVFVAVNYGMDWFQLVHLTFWKIVSGIYVALVWIFLVNKYKIKSIPIIDDLKYLYNLIRKNPEKR